MGGYQQAAASSGLSVHSLFVGSRDGRAFLDYDRQAVIEATATVFDGFTVIGADGYFKGRSVATLVIQIASDEQTLLEALARRLGVLLAQEAIGLEASGQYRSIIID